MDTFGMSIHLPKKEAEKPMRTLGNIIWFLFGGLICALGWVISGLICCVTIIGIPVGLQAFKFASFVLWPFGGILISAEWVQALFW